MLWVLRDVLNLTGTKYGCGIEVCGACTVMVDGQREHACVFDVSWAVGEKIVTIEGLSRQPQPPRATGVDCQAGAAVRLLRAGDADGHGLCDEGRATRFGEIASEVKNLCVCGTYPARQAGHRRPLDLRALKGEAHL